MSFLEFDCAAAANELKKQLGILTKLDCSTMMCSLYAKDVITYSERKIIDAKVVGEEKMIYLLVDIIIPSLKTNICTKYKGFLEAMEESADVILRSMAARLGKLITIYLAIKIISLMRLAL